MNMKKTLVLSIILFLTIIVFFYFFYKGKYNGCFQIDYKCRYNVLINSPITKWLDIENEKAYNESVKRLVSKYSDMEDYLFLKAETIYEIKYYSLDFVLSNLNKEKYNILLKQNKIKSFDAIYK